MFGSTDSGPNQRINMPAVNSETIAPPAPTSSKIPTEHGVHFQWPSSKKDSGSDVSDPCEEIVDEGDEGWEAGAAAPVVPEPVGVRDGGHTPTSPEVVAPASATSIAELSETLVAIEDELEDVYEIIEGQEYVFRNAHFTISGAVTGCRAQSRLEKANTNVEQRNIALETEVDPLTEEIWQLGVKITRASFANLHYLLHLLEECVPLAYAVYERIFRSGRFDDYLAAVMRSARLMTQPNRQNYKFLTLLFCSDVLYSKISCPDLYRILEVKLAGINDYPIENQHSKLRPRSSDQLRPAAAPAVQTWLPDMSGMRIGNADSAISLSVPGLKVDANSMPAAYCGSHLCKNSIRPPGKASKHCDPRLRTCWGCDESGEQEDSVWTLCGHWYHARWYGLLEEMCDLCDGAVYTAFHAIAKAFNSNHDAALGKQLKKDQIMYEKQEGRAGASKGLDEEVDQADQVPLEVLDEETEVVSMQDNGEPVHVESTVDSISRPRRLS
ncbi:hypothetical protein BCR44DRAFT_1463493 [Catenaria anguillulae PL171]|uniref:Uncharacterized protein n=1 Tax=Catenaria anguillulae PL171 TaxID=765915 RepID=A0A1Y2HBJ5_9FUNG|nr:hypothetical protein BCR44DRAFT_1463493 [Catenaria anguillulae PL171]